jgi:hypothetical protein
MVGRKASLSCSQPQSGCVFNGDYSGEKG